MSQIMKASISFFTAFSMLIGTSGFTAAAAPVTNTEPGGSQIIKIPCGMANCYLIVGKDQCILVDTAGASSRKKVYAAVKNFKVTLIILTHGHYDHSQNAAFLAEKFGAKIAMSKVDFELIANPSAQKAAGRTILQKLSGLFSNLFSSAIKIDSFEPDFYLADGQSLADYGVEGKIVELKGHTKGSIGILLNNGKDFIVGDALMNFFKVTEPFLFENYDDLCRSMNIIKDTGADVYPGHGKSYSQA
ncbi:MAG: MBL fold metallo-hydrolase [Eubacteriales bacterium]